MAINSFRGDYRFLSNFYSVWVPLEGHWYPSTEHAYQAAKTEDPKQRAEICNSATPGEAKRLGKELSLRSGWESLKIGYMRYLVWYKFMMYPDLGKLLTDTGNEELIEGNTWGDTFWGVCNGKGENWLGRILMEVRDQVRKLGPVETPPVRPQDKVFVPGPSRVFVFGSNLSGIHGAGAAKTAFEQYGAVWGVGEGPMPDAVSPTCYGLPTKDEHIETLPLDRVEEYVDKFILYAWERRDLTFFITRIGCGLAGFVDHQIHPFFKDAPPNCELPNGWDIYSK